MSIVGPRPLVKEGYDFYPREIRESIYKNQPGVTGLGSLILRDEEKYLSGIADPKLFYETEIIPYKGALEIWYQRNQSIFIDTIIIFLTAWIILFPKSDLHNKILRGLPASPDWL